MGKIKDSQKEVKEAICKYEGCKNKAHVEGYCRLHFIKNVCVNKIQKRRSEFLKNALKKYVTKIALKYPIEYLVLIKKDLEEKLDIIDFADIEENIQDEDTITKDKIEISEDFFN